MKINSKRLTTVAVSTFATLALSSFSFCLGSRLSPYHMQIVGKYFDDVETYEKLSMTSKKFGNLTKRYYQNFVNISQVSKDKYFPNIQTYVAYPGAGPLRLNMFSRDIKHLVYLENSFDQAKFRQILCSAGVISLNRGGEVTFRSKNWMCKKLPTESGKGFIILLTGIGKKNEGKTIEFHFDPIKLSVVSGKEYDIYSGVRNYNILVDDISHILSALGIELENIKYGSVTRINIPQSVKRIEDGCFGAYGSLREVNVPNCVEFIGESAFDSCTNLEKIKLPDALKKISNRTFQNCTCLKSLEIPHGVEEIGERAFDFCIMLNNIKFPDTVKEIGKAAFLGCASFTEITVPGSVKEIKKFTFACCRSLEKVMISEGTECIDRFSFMDCQNLTQVTIPVSVKRVDRCAFADCPRLTNIKYDGKTYPNVNSFMTAFEAKRKTARTKDC